MMRTTILPRVALCLLCSSFFIWGKQALADCVSQCPTCEPPPANRYCASPVHHGPGHPRQEIPLWTPLLEILPPLGDKCPRQDYYVQMYSGQCRDRALMKQYQFAHRFDDVLGCCALQLRRIDIGFMGPYWSVWAGPVKSKELANALCQDLLLHGLRRCVVEPQ